MPPALPSFRSYLLSYAMERFFKKIPYLRFEDRCTGCEACVSSCPIGNIEIGGDGRININEKECTGCMVCIEACREGALDYRVRHERLYGIGRKIYHIRKSMR